MLSPRHFSRRHSSIILTASIASLLLAAAQLPVRAADGTWILSNNPTAPATNNWSDSVNWFNGAIADGADGKAYFVYNPGTLGGDNGANITLDSSRTIGSIFMTDTDGQGSSSIGINGSNASILTLQTSSGVPTIDVGFLLNNGFSGKKAILNSALTLAGTQGFNKTGLGFLSLRMPSILTGSINVIGGTLDTRVVLNNNIAVSGGTLNLDFAASAPTTDLIGASQTLSLGGTTGSGFVTNGFKASTNHSQTVSSLTVNRGGNAITATNAGATFSTTWNLGQITRSAGGALNLATSGAGTSTFNFTPGESVLGNDSSGIIGGWATFNANDWAVANGGVINATGVSYTNNTWGSNLNTTVSGANFPALPGVNTQTNATTHTLRFQDGSSRLLTLSGTNTIETGGILFGNSGNSMHQINGGALTPGSGVSDLTVHAYSSAGGWGTIINSNIIDNGSPVQLVKAGGGNLVLDGDKSFTGGTVVGQGTLVLGKALGGSNSGAVVGSILNSGVLAFNRSGTYTPTNSITGNGVIAQWSEGNLVLTKTVSAGGLDLRNGTTTLDFSAAGAPASNIVPAGEPSTNGLYTGGGRLTLRDATLNIVGASGTSSVQHFALTDIQGSTSINLTPGSGGGTVALELGAYLRPNNNNDGAGTLKLSLPAGATLNVQPSVPGAASSLVADNGQAFVTVNGNDWGAKNATNTQIVAGSSIASFYANLSTLTAGSNADYDTNTTVTAATALGSLRFNTVTTPGSLTVNSGAQLKLGGVLVTPNATAATTIAGPGTISAANAGGRDLVVFQNSAQPLTISAVIANNSATAADTTNLVKEGAGELVLNGANTYTGKTYVQGGLLRVTSGNIGTSSAVAGNVFIREGEMRLENSASVNTGGNFVSIGQRLGEVGTLTLKGNSTWSTAADFNVSDVNSTGTLNVQDSAALNANNFYVGKGGSSIGTVNISGGTVAVTTGTSDIRIGGNNAGDSLAQGTINQTAGTFSVSRNFQLGANGAGVYNQSGGTFTATGGFAVIGRYVSGQGTWNVSGGTLDVTPGSGTAFIIAEQGSGVLNVSNTGSVLAKSFTLGHNGGVGVVNQTGGSVSLNATGSVTFGTAFQAGLILAPQGAASDATYNLSGGTLSTQAISKGAGTGVFNFNGGTLLPIAFNPTFMAGLTAANVQAGGAKIDTNGFDITIDQGLQHAPTLGPAVDGGLAKSGEGILTVSGASTYSGPTSVTAGTLLVSGSLSGTTALNVSGGTFQLAGADRVNDAATVTLGSGTLSTDGFAETLGSFTLQGTATLDLGNGASILHFANSSALTWTGTLSITNWSGSALGGSTDQLFFGNSASALTSAQLAKIQFINPAGFTPGSYSAGILPSGEIVAVPEPNVVVSLLGGVGLLLGIRRRR